MEDYKFDDMKKKMMNIGDSLSRIEMPVRPAIPEIPESHLNPARWMYKRLGEYVKNLENELDEDHEIGARLVSFGQSVKFNIENVGYYGPDIIMRWGQARKRNSLIDIDNVSSWKGFFENKAICRFATVSYPGTGLIQIPAP